MAMFYTTEPALHNCHTVFRERARLVTATAAAANIRQVAWLQLLNHPCSAALTLKVLISCPAALPLTTLQH